MKELAGRLTALDPDAGAAVRVIAYFDRLAESRAGLEALVRGAAVLAGCPARLVDPERRVHVRVETDGTRRDTGTPPDPAWPAVRLSPDGTAMLWLERGGDGAGPAGVVSGPVTVARAGGGDAEHGGPAAVLDPRPAQAAAPGQARTQRTPSVVDAVILERAAGAVRLVLDRTRGRAPAHDPALVETLLDATAPEPARLHAARRLGLDPTAPARAVAPLNGRPRVIPAAPEAGPGNRLSASVSPQGTEGTDRASANVSLDRPALPGPRLPAGRLGVGSAVPVLELPRSWAEARTALRFTAEGTPQDPGPRVVYADELGGVALLADLVPPGSEPPADVRSLEAAAATAHWLPVTLHAITSTSSLRAAAAEINVHHSTLQERLAHAEHLLGWPIRTPQGRLRLHLALTMRRLARP
ncbi:PucR family transcriptional regulator [Streptomyces luteogriseus]|uniref:PucR family transcriptional regulator n=1 Tax=Streptomyces luteogriseus TaxID=68233 RepID=UPI0027D8D4D0|nr:helix-turn-helix domain-containing protein [Streptomyces luteogriseus]